MMPGQTSVLPVSSRCMRKNLLSFLIIGLLLITLAILLFPEDKEVTIPEHELQSQVDAL